MRNPNNGKGRLQKLVANAVLLAALTVSTASSQAQPPAPLRSPEVQSDRRVTFRFRAPNAKEVFLTREGGPRLPMTKDDKGVWSVTTDVLEPDLYGYSFVADGVRLIDPANPLMKPNLLNTESMVHVPGPSSLMWEVNDVPHGAVTRHFYKSGVVGDNRDFYVYTPPGYDAKANKKYPVMYLLHGYSDDASGWTAVGRAHVIMDNLIAQGKAKPMLVVMPLGYGAPEVVSPGGPGGRDPNLFVRNAEKFTEALLKEVIPTVEKAYRAETNRENRAVVGLSMGGGEALGTGLNNLDKFAYVGSFSGAVMLQGNDYNKAFAGLDSKANSRLRLLWIGVGTEDFLLQTNRQFRDWLKSKDVKATYVETPGAHTWLVWRRYLSEFAPMLFR